MSALNLRVVDVATRPATRGQASWVHRLLDDAQTLICKPDKPRGGWAVSERRFLDLRVQISFRNSYRNFRGAKSDFEKRLLKATLKAVDIGSKDRALPAWGGRLS
ncbi:MAG: hypothetical protein ACF788_03730 [Novipirellula sp. JB048]